MTPPKSKRERLEEIKNYAVRNTAVPSVLISVDTRDWLITELEQAWLNIEAMTTNAEQCDEQFAELIKERDAALAREEKLVEALKHYTGECCFCCHYTGSEAEEVLEAWSKAKGK